LNANGGAGGSGDVSGDSGGGGRIKIFYNTFTNTGTLTASGHQAGSIYLEQEATNYPTNVTVNTGADETIEWEMDDIILNLTESPVTVEIDMSGIVSYIDEDCTDYEYYCLLPIQIASETPGIIQYDNINFTYEFNPIVMNVSKFNLSGNTVDINFSGEQIGLTELSGVNFTYNGRYTYNVTGYNTTDQLEHMLDIYLPYTWTDEILPYPTSNSSRNVTPWAQDSDTPIYNVTTQCNHSVNISIALEQELNSCINVTASTSSSKTGGSFINTTDRVTVTNLNETDDTGFWLWFDLWNCDYYTTRWFEPNVTVDNCCFSCLSCW